MLRADIGSLNEKALNESIKLKAFEQKFQRLEKQICLINIINKIEEIFQISNQNPTQQLGELNTNKRKHESEILDFKKENQTQNNDLTRSKTKFIEHVEEALNLTILIIMMLIALNVNILISLAALHLISTTENPWSY